MANRPGMPIKQSGDLNRPKTRTEEQQCVNGSTSTEKKDYTEIHVQEIVDKNSTTKEVDMSVKEVKGARSVKNSEVPRKKDQKKRSSDQEIHAVDSIERSTEGNNISRRKRGRPKKFSMKQIGDEAKSSAENDTVFSTRSTTADEIPKNGDFQPPRSGKEHAVLVYHGKLDNEDSRHSGLLSKTVEIKSLCQGMSTPSIFSTKKAPAQKPKGAPIHPSSSTVKDTPPPPSQTTKSTEVPASEPLPKRQKLAGKKQNSSLNQVERHFADIGDTIVTSEELQTWRAKSQEDKDTFALKASSELLVHLMDREKNKLEQGAALKEAKDEITDLKKAAEGSARELKEAMDGWEKTEKFLDAEKKRVKELEGEVESLKKANTSLETANSFLQADKENGWAEEKERLETAAFEDGLNSYIATFLAGAPSFDWEPQFGRGIATFMKDFQSKHAELVAFKKEELEKILANEAKANDPAEEQIADQMARPLDPNSSNPSTNDNVENTTS